MIYEDYQKAPLQRNNARLLPALSLQETVILVLKKLVQ